MAEATPLQQLLIERSGFLLGLEAPKPLDPEKSKVPRNGITEVVGFHEYVFL